MTIGRAFMSLQPVKAGPALQHYDLAIAKRMNSEDLYFFRAESNYELGQLNAALIDLEKCLEYRKDHQKYLLFKASIQYEMGAKDAAYKTYFNLCELYDKQTPFFMLVVINLEREMYNKARQQIEDNMLRFERGQDFWRLTAEQQVRLEWHVFKAYSVALKAQESLLGYKPDNVPYLINRLSLYRLQGLDSLGQWAENDLQSRYNMNKLPVDLYKKGRIKVGEYIRTNGTVEDYRTFRPHLFGNTKYTRFYISSSGVILGKHWAGLVRDSKDSTALFWDFHRGDAHFTAVASDTSYSGFIQLLETPDSSLSFVMEEHTLTDSSEFIPSTGNTSDSLFRSNETPFQERPAKEEPVIYTIPVLDVKRDTI
jgi:tetratricopeptide (TPR) repeat protein